jgi:hypothetical protein
MASCQSLLHLGFFSTPPCLMHSVSDTLAHTRASFVFRLFKSTFDRTLHFTAVGSNVHILTTTCRITLSLVVHPRSTPHPRIITSAHTPTSPPSPLSTHLQREDRVARQRELAVPGLQDAVHAHAGTSHPRVRAVGQHHTDCAPVPAHMQGEHTRHRIRTRT